MATYTQAEWKGLTPRRWQAEAHREAITHLSQDDPAPAVISAVMGAGKAKLIAELCASTKLEGDEVIVVSTSTELLVESLYRTITDRINKPFFTGLFYGRRKRDGKCIVACTPSVGRLAEKLRIAGKRVALWIADEAHRTECESILTAQATLNPAASIGLTATPFRSEAGSTMSLYDELIYRYSVADALKDGNVLVPWRIQHARDIRQLDDECIRMVAEAKGPGIANASSIEDAQEFAALLSDNGFSARTVHSGNDKAANKSAINALRDGAIRCIVHVNMLTEGADYPFLRWLLLRRDVGSRVRFIQEIGRLLRWAPGKQEAVYYDPHDLFGKFSLSYAEALGEAVDKPSPEAVAERTEMAAEKIANERESTALAWIESAIRALSVAVDVEGGFGPDKQKVKQALANRPSTEMQQMMAARLIDNTISHCRDVPDGWRACLWSIRTKIYLLRYKFASELIASLDAINKNGEWPSLNSAGQIYAQEGSSLPPGVQTLMDFGDDNDLDEEADRQANGLGANPHVKPEDRLA